MVTMILSSCWSETCDWQIGMLFIQENYSLTQFAWWEKNLKNGVPEEIHKKGGSSIGIWDHCMSPWPFSLNLWGL